MVLPADPPATMTADAQTEDAKLPPAAPAAEELPAEAAAEELPAEAAAEEETAKVVAATAVSVASEDKEEEKEEKPKENGKEAKPAAEEEEESEKENVGVVQKSSSFKEESNFLSDLREHERKALLDLRAMMDEAIIGNKLFSEGEEKGAEKESKEEAKSEEHANAEAAKGSNDVSLWGVPLLASKGSEGTDVVLLKFLRAREFRAKEAFEMLRNTLRWRREARINAILEEGPLGEGLEAAAYMDGADREGHPVCYNIYGVFRDAALYEAAFGSEENAERFLRWRFQLMEKGIQKLDLRPGGVASMLQITDLKDSPGISKKELRAAMKRAVGLLQDNYPEFVAKNIFINVPFWYYAFNSLLSPFLTQRTKSKFIFARPARVTETLLKYIPAEDFPIRYGGLKRENDAEFSVQDGGVSELIVKAGSVENVEIPMTEVGTTVVWDLTVLGWEVNYKEEFVPTDEGSYTILLQKGKKMGYQEEPVRNSFRNSEPGKVVLIIENTSFWKKKVLFRYKTKSSS